MERVDNMTGKSPIVSVIIPTYNSSGTLKLSLETVLRQEFGDYEVWIIGDGCSDDSATVIGSFGDDRVHWVNLPTNSGTPSVPRNEGLRLARGQFIAYLGHDDLWFPWHLSELVDCIERSNSDFVYSLGILLSPEGVIGTFSLPKNPWRFKEQICPSNWLHRKTLSQVVGLWSPEIKFGDDRNFLQRILAANVQLDFQRQLSVLKYPAGLWQMYSLTSNFPQLKHVEAIRNNAEALRLELLLDLAKTMSWERMLFPRHTSCRLLHELVRLFLDIYGRQRWPINNFYYWRWRRSSGLVRKQHQEFDT
jgi:glycosyltransferase involved in cell wall biosynthesis